ncbi:MAG: hypothetical protein R6V05_09730 [Candidatus Brocadiia bacterium]
MNSIRCAAVLALLVTCAAVPAPAAEQRGPETRTVKIPVKQYKALTTDGVYRAAVEGIQANVRFRDSFSSEVPLPEAVRQVRVGGRSYQIEIAFRTGSELICLVPSENWFALGTLMDVGPGWAASPAALNRPVALREGQQIIIEGQVAGTEAGAKYVVVDAIHTDDVDSSAVRRDLRIFLPGENQPRVVEQTGTTVLEFPCTWVEGETEKLTVDARELGPDEVAGRVAQLSGALEGLSGMAKSYGRFSPGAVYQHAGDPERVNVDFTDRVAEVMAPPLPQELAAAPAVRRGSPVQVQVAYAFETAGRVTCLVPFTYQTVYLQATQLLPGERVLVRGTTVGPRGANNCVLVDYLDPVAPEGMEEELQPWWVTFRLGDAGPAQFLWDYGYHSFPNLPCQYAAGRSEPVTMWLTRVRTVEVPVQRPAPAPQEEETEEAEEAEAAEEAEEAPAEEQPEQPAPPAEAEEEEPEEATAE